MEEEKRHTYEYAVDLQADTAPARVIRMVGDGKRVLEIGAGPGSITKHLRHANDCRITALELDAEAIKKLTPFCERVYQANLNDADWPERLASEGKFEVVVAADVLEHVYDPLTVLKQMSTFLSDEGGIIISLPHAGHSAIHACLFDEDFEYRDWGLLDRTHIRFFGIKNIQALFEKAGLKIVHAEYVVRIPEITEFADRWSRLDPELRRVLSKNPFGQVYQVVVKAVPVSAVGEGVSLMSMLPSERVTASRWAALKNAARLYMSHRFRAAVKRSLGTLGIRI